MYKIGMVILLCGFLVSPVAAQTKQVHPTKTGDYWQTLVAHYDEAAMQLYTSGYIDGVNDALHQIAAAMDGKSISKNERNTLIESFRFPQNVLHREIKREMDAFYQEPGNHELPLWVAFTAARQKLQGYPKSYSEAYLEQMRKEYAKPAK